jgi:hypothetical protein
MAMNGVIVYFPWGGAGNLVKNVITLDTRFEFLDDQSYAGEYPTQESRFNWLYEYYSRPVEPETWLPREWSIRTKSHAKYYVNNEITYWNANKLVVYDVHGEENELDNNLKRGTLQHFDRVRIEMGQVQEQDSTWRLTDCEQVFLIPKNIKLITEIYNSKNPTINQLEHEGDLAYRQQEAQIINNTMSQRLVDLQHHFDSCGVKHHDYVADELYKTTGADALLDITAKLNLTISEEYVRMIHSVWLSSTNAVYTKYFNKELDI